MTLPNATGFVARPQEILRTSLAACSAFQTWVGASDATAAASRIHHYDLPRPEFGDDTHTLAYLEALRPLAVVRTATESGVTFTFDSAGASFGFHERGRLICCLEDNVGDDDFEQYPKVERVVQNLIGAIISSSGDLDNPGLLELAGQATYLAIRELDVDGPYFSNPGEETAQGVFWRVYLGITWGMQ